MITRPPTLEELRFHCFVGKEIVPTRNFVECSLSYISPSFYTYKYRHKLIEFGTFRFRHSFFSSPKLLHDDLRSHFDSLPDKNSDYNTFIHYISCPEVGLYTNQHTECIDLFRSLYKEFDLPARRIFLWIFTLHPLIANEFNDSELTLVTGPFVDPKFHLFSSLPGCQDAQKVYQLGEFWVSYSDGTEEEKYLLQGLPRP